MRLILGTVTVGALIVLPGCAKTIYEKPGATAAEFNQDPATTRPLPAPRYQAIRS